MKKSKLVATTTLVMSLVLLWSCSGKKDSTKSSSLANNEQSSSVSKSTVSKSSSSTDSTLSSTSSQAKMNIQAIFSGDYSSIKGTWKNKTGHTMMFDENGLVAEATSFGDSAEIKDGLLHTDVYSMEGFGYALIMVPSGVVIPSNYFYDGSDPSDISRDRMYGTQNTLTVENFDPLYKISNLSSVEDWKLAETGIILENGQSTIDYANQHLVDQGWNIIEDNYNRTEGVPYSLVQDSNGSPYLYYIYRNGVILSKDGSLVYAP